MGESPGRELMKVMLLGARWQQCVPEGCCCTWGAGLSTGEGHQSLELDVTLADTPGPCGVPRAESL